MAMLGMQDVGIAFGGPAVLDHARKQGVQVHQPATVGAVTFDGEGVTLQVEAGGEQTSHRARFLVDASGRDGFVAGRFGRLKAFPDCVAALDKAIKLKDSADLHTRRGVCRHGFNDDAGGSTYFLARRA